MAVYTSRDRILAALKGTYGDRIPVTIMFGPYVAKLAGYTMPEIFNDPEKHAKAHVAAYETFRTDTIGINRVVYMEAESLGAEVAYSEKTTPQLKTHVLDDKSVLEKLDMPDPRKNSRLKWYLQACTLAKAALPGVAVSGSISGPWTLAANLRGLDTLIMDTMDDPGFVHDLMKFSVAYLKEWGMVLRETGVGSGMGEASASCSVISPKIYREFIQPYHREIFSFFKERKLNISVHICGYIDPIMEDLLDTGVSMISIDSISSLSKLKELSMGNAVIMGNVPPSLFVDATRKQMEDAVRSCIDIGAKDSKYLLSSGCEIPFNSRRQNIEYFMQAAEKYGTYENRSEG
jgi:uroporphyrinogen decarboxylase